MSRTVRRNRKTGKFVPDGEPRRRMHDRSCGNHGSCPWCRGNRSHASQRAQREYRQVPLQALVTDDDDSQQE